MKKAMLQLLSEYLRIDTAHPAPDYEKAIALLKNHAEQEGFTTQLVSLPSGRVVLIITFEGSDLSLPSLLLNHHMDVVPAEGRWDYGPFEGSIVHGRIIGRGVQDMKGVGIVHYAALKALKDQGVPLQRTVHLVAVPDEEIGGFTGTGEFVDSESFKMLKVGYVLDEGLPSGSPDELYLKISERKPLQIRVTAVGAAGHGSHLHIDNAVHTLIEFLQVLVALHKKNQLQAQHHDAARLLSTHITSLQAGVYKDGRAAYNAIGQSAHAVVDIRVPSSMKMKEVEAFLNQTSAQLKGVSYQVLKKVDDYDVFEMTGHILYKTVYEVLSGYGIKPVDHHFQATTDARFYCMKGISVLGFTPFSSQPQLHDVNESLDVDDFNRGIDIMRDVIGSFCR